MLQVVGGFDQPCGARLHWVATHLVPTPLQSGLCDGEVCAAEGIVMHCLSSGHVWTHYMTALVIHGSWNHPFLGALILSNSSIRIRCCINERDAKIAWVNDSHMGRTTKDLSIDDACLGNHPKDGLLLNLRTSIEPIIMSRCSNQGKVQVAIPVVAVC